jgi:hypothetical protein
VSDVERLVKDQPNPKIFLKIFLELGYKSMIPYISFDMRSIANILNEKNTEYFDKKFPIFYAGEDGNSPIDIALENDQIRSVNLIIKYVVQYQNNYVYQFLFLKNFVDLLNKGIHLTPLLQSSILNYAYDFDEWPSQHSMVEKRLAPFNKSIFKIRYAYPRTFQDIFEYDQEKEAQRRLSSTKKTEKEYKIFYHLIMITNVSEESGSLMEAIANSEEMDIFEEEVI